MAQTVIPWGDAKAIKKWGANLAVDVNRKGYWSRKFIGQGMNNIIEQKDELVSDKGDRISFDLSVQLRQEPTFGDNTVDGKGEALRFFTDEVAIDQIRHQVNAGGRMTRKRTAHDLRKIAKDRLGDYWKLFIDEMFFMYLSGARGVNNFIMGTTFTGFAGNSFQAPDAAHILFGGAAKAKAEITTSDKMSKALIERACTAAKMMSQRDTEACSMLPMDVDGEGRFICVMSTYQAHDLRTADTSGWMDIQKALITAEGKNTPIFKGGLGMINNVVLHEHEDCVRFSDYGASTNLPAARALFLGRQAGVVAYGTPENIRFSWTEEMKDAGNQPVVTSGPILGMKKTRFNGRDFGVMALDTYAKDPEAA